MVSRLNEACPKTLLSVVQYAMHGYSPHVSSLYPKAAENPLRSIHSDFLAKIGVKPVMSPEQFLRPGFEQEKLRFVLQVVKAVREIHKRMAKPL